MNAQFDLLVIVYISKRIFIGEHLFFHSSACLFLCL